MHFIRIHNGNTALLEQFVKNAGDSLNTFRYFDKRPFTIIAQHVCTWVIKEKQEVVAYGHLDKEDGVVWLGIAVVASARGRGYGGEMMKRLMQSAAGCGLRSIRLSVDHENKGAIHLYEYFGFKLIERREAFGFYEWKATPGNYAIISSLAFMGNPIEEVVKIGEKEKMPIEFSSGMAFSKKAEKMFLEAKCERFAHNYFPAPEKPFVLNLASSDEKIRNKSIAHCVNGIELSYKAGAPFFSAHSGFCIDPKPEELGRELSRVDTFDRGVHWKYFIGSIKEILGKTKELPTGFLLENNVLAKFNVYPNGANPLLNVRAEEMKRMINEVNDPRVGMLVDTAHLKVSSVTLNFDLVKEMRSIPEVRCIHHSDNDGLKDDNRPFDTHYWFLSLMPEYPGIPHVLEVRKQEMPALKEMESLLFPRA